MLPISKHRTLVIPHRLALVAAALCLALSFSADRADVETQLHVDRDEPIEQLEATNGGSASVAHPKQSGKSSSRSGNPSLLPWFSGLMY